MDEQIIKDFLALPLEALPSADWVEFCDSDMGGDCWSYLYDYILPKINQRYSHIGSPIRLRADRDEWKNGIIVRV
jgi:hypothetical protein